MTTVKGLVLVGGKSSRMGKDKAQLNYFGKPQKERAKDILESCGLETYYAVNHSKRNSLNTYEIADILDNKGPLAGICAAFKKERHTAWLVLATDLPFIDKAFIQLLLKNRNPKKIATTVQGMHKEYIEPLATIYEPASHPILLNNLEKGVLSPLKILKKNTIEILQVQNHYLNNINTLQEFIQAKKELDSKK